jgi:hypothetical protein
MIDGPLEYSDYRLDILEPAAECQPWPKETHCRRRLHKAFLQWHSDVRGKFAIELELLKRTDECLQIGFCRIGRILTETLTTYELDIAVEWRGTRWDLLRSFDAAPERVPGGYICGLCPEANRPIFPSRDAVWRSDIFEPFLEWVNGELADAVGVSISGAPGSSTWRSSKNTRSLHLRMREAPARSAVPDGSLRLGPPSGWRGLPCALAGQTGCRCRSRRTSDRPNARAKSRRSPLVRLPVSSSGRRRTIRSPCVMLRSSSSVSLSSDRNLIVGGLAFHRRQNCLTSAGSDENCDIALPPFKPPQAHFSRRGQSFRRQEGAKSRSRCRA